MTSGISLGTSTDKWQMWQQEQMNATKAKMNKSGYVSKTDNSNNTQQVQVTKTSENTCTDGNDDGKIGFFAAAGHAIKGAAKGLWNGIKGCFTNSEGKFSLGKTLLTVGMGALCIAFPAVGLVACGIGAVSGAVTLGKGIYNAATAETDAQAKDAWENIGDGAFTVVTSAAGAKASFKAVKATSTAGISSVDDAAKAAEKAGASLDKIDDIQKLDNVDDAIKAVQEIGGDTSKLGNLAEDATKLDKAKALLSDSWSSTKNQGVKVKALGTELKNEAKLNKEAKKYNSNMEEKAALEAKKMETSLTAEEQTRLTELEKIELDTKIEIKKQADSLQQKASQKQTLADDVKTAEENLKTAEKQAKEAQKSAKQGSKTTAAEALQQNADEAIKGAADAKEVLAKAKTNQFNNTKFGQVTSKFKSKITKNSKTYEAISEQRANLKDAVANAEGIGNKVNVIKENANSATFRNIANGLADDGKAIYQLLTSTDSSNGYVQAVNKYGYNNVLQVIEAFTGYRMADESI